MRRLIDPSGLRDRPAAPARYRRRSAREWRIRHRPDRRSAARPARSASGPGTRSSISCRSPMNVSDCQSVDWKLVSKILSRSMPALAISARSSPAAAGDSASFIIGSSPGRRERVGPSSGAARGPLRRSNTKRGSPIASRPNRAAGVLLLLRYFSTSLRRCTVVCPHHFGDSASASFPMHFLLV